MPMSKANGSLHKPRNYKKANGGKNCFVVPPSEQPTIDSSAVVNPSPSEVLNNEPYVVATTNADSTVAASSTSAVEANTLMYAAGMSIEVTFYHHIYNDSSARSFWNDLSFQQDNVHVAFSKIHNFQMKLKEKVAFSYDASKTKSQITGEAVLYPYFCPWAGDVFIYEVSTGVYGLYKITDPPTRLTGMEGTGHEIKFILVSYLDSAQIAKLDALVVEELYFNLEHYISTEGGLLTSDESETLTEAETAIVKLSKYYVSEYYDKYIYRTFIENPCLYDPYIVEFIKQTFDYKYLRNYPTQLVPSPEWWSRSFWARLLDPYTVPEAVVVNKCYRVLKGVHYRTAGINALTNRCYIRLHPHGRHDYPPFTIPDNYDKTDTTIQMQLCLYLTQGKIRPKVLLELTESILSCSRLAQFYFIPILVFLLNRLRAILTSGGGGISIETEEEDTGCSNDCQNCIYNCSCQHQPGLPPIMLSSGSHCQEHCGCCTKHTTSEASNSSSTSTRRKPKASQISGRHDCDHYRIPKDGGSRWDDHLDRIMEDCGEDYEGLPDEERRSARRHSQHHHHYQDDASDTSSGASSSGSSYSGSSSSSSSRSTWDEDVGG